MSVNVIASTFDKMSVTERAAEDSVKNVSSVTLNIDTNLDSCSPIEAVVLRSAEPGSSVAQNIDRLPSNTHDINVNDRLNDAFINTPNRKRVLGSSLRCRSRPCIITTEHSILPISPIARPPSSHSELLIPSLLSSSSCSPIQNRPIVRARRVILSRDSTQVPTSPLTSSPIPVNKRLQSLVRDSHTSVATPLAYLASAASSPIASPLSSPVTHNNSPSSNIHNHAFRELTPGDFEDEKEIASKKRRF